MSSTTIAPTHSTAITTEQPPMDKEEEEAVAALLQLCIPQLTVKVDMPVSEKRKGVTKPKTAIEPKGTSKAATSTKPELTSIATRKSVRINAKAHPQRAPSSIPKVSVKRMQKEEQKKCSNCRTTSTPTWRRLNDKLVCNACGLHYRLHKVHRPIKMQSDHVITRRKHS